MRGICKEQEYGNPPPSVLGIEGGPGLLGSWGEDMSVEGCACMW